MKNILTFCFLLFAFSSFSQLEIGGIGYGTTNPASSGATAYKAFYNTTSNSFNWWNGSSWIPAPNGTAWLLGGQNTTANAQIGTSDAFRFGISTNGIARQYFSSDGRIFSGTVTDWITSPSDSAALRIGGTNGWVLSTGFSRLVANGLISFQANHTTGATAFIVPDNTATATSITISGGNTAFQVNSTDGAEVTTVGTSSSGATTNIQAPALQVNGTAVSTVWSDGVWTPTLTNVTNVGSSTTYECQWMRIGSTVTVSGMLDIDATSVGTTQVGISLPIASNFAAVEKAAGTAKSNSTTEGSAHVYADTTNDRLALVFTCVDTATQLWRFTATYRIQ
jgi:hypothetical protein